MTPTPEEVRGKQTEETEVCMRTKGAIWWLMWEITRRCPHKLARLSVKNQEHQKPWIEKPDPNASYKNSRLNVNSEAKRKQLWLNHRYHRTNVEDASRDHPHMWMWICGWSLPLGSEAYCNQKQHWFKLSKVCQQSPRQSLAIQNCQASTAAPDGFFNNSSIFHVEKLHSSTLLHNWHLTSSRMTDRTGGHKDATAAC